MKRFLDELFSLTTLSLLILSITLMPSQLFAQNQSTSDPVMGAAGWPCFSYWSDDTCDDDANSCDTNKACTVKKYKILSHPDCTYVVYRYEGTCDTNFLDFNCKCRNLKRVTRSAILNISPEDIPYDAIPIDE